LGAPASYDLEAELGILERERDRLLARFTENHPDVIRIHEEIAALERRLTKAPAQSENIDDLKQQLALFERQYRETFEKLNEAKLEEAKIVSDVRTFEKATV